MGKPNPSEEKVNRVLGGLRELTDETTKRVDEAGRLVADIIFSSNGLSLERRVQSVGLSSKELFHCLPFLVKAGLVEEGRRGHSRPTRWVVLDHSYKKLSK